MADAAKVRRQVTKGAFTRFVNWFTSNKDKPIEDINLEEFQSRLTKAEALLDDFNDAQFIIETNDVNFDTNVDTVHATERHLFEDRFFEITGAAKSFMLKHSVVDPDRISLSSRNTAATPTQVSTNIQLPPINLPTYDGAYDKWLFFRDTFKSIIHDNVQLSNIQKFHYLRLALKSAAADTITSLEVSDATYETAWLLLQERFENKNILVNSHINALFSLPAVHRDSHQELRHLLDSLQHHLRSLESLNLQIDHWDPLIIHLVMTKLDNSTHREWEQKNTSSSLPKLADLFKFLKNKCHVLETLDATAHEKKTTHNNIPRKPFKALALTNDNTAITCFVCKQKHMIYSCPDFLKLEPFARLNQAKRLRLCVNCLCKNHPTKDCKSSGCRKCGSIHHTLLHFNNATQQTGDNKIPSPTQQQTNHTDPSTSHNPLSLTVHNSYNKNPSQILLSTAMVQILDKNNTVHVVRALLDNGSQSNFITEGLCHKLGLPKNRVNFSISGISHVNSPVSHSASVQIKSKVINYSKTLSCLVLPVITGNIPSSTFDQTLLNIPTNIVLADPTFNNSLPIELLIGADTFWDLICVGQIKLGSNKPILQKTKLGYIVSGPIFLPNSVLHATVHCNFSHVENLDLQLRKFWELEELPPVRHFSDEEKACEKYFKDTTTTDETGRFIVSLPFKDSVSKLGDSRLSATKRFISLENKLNRNNDLKGQYTEFINEYISLNHMSPCPNPMEDSGFFLPHHAVLKDSSSTTKLRVVFDGSAKSTSGISLNDLLMVGPTIQDDLVSIILRFRQHAFVLSADIAKMYRQVLIKNDERHLQKFIWRTDPEAPISVFELNTVTYGTSSAPFLAIRALHEIAYLHADKYPLATQIILQDFYVDDLLTGASTIEKIQQIKDELSTLLSKHGFSLRKWRSNISFDIGTRSSTDLLPIAEDQTSRTLGLIWNPNIDTLQYDITSQLQNNKRVTKRTILSSVARIFDPLGLLSCVTITAKIILQELWKLKLSWDESIPADLHSTWSTYVTQLPKLNNLKIPRHVICQNPVRIELHGFSDASSVAYGACVFVRSCDSSGKYHCNLLIAKTRVAPIKQLTIPRLELCGALLLAELVEKIERSFQITFNSIHYWCDSTIVISWIHTSRSLLKTFAANRVAQIQSLSSPNAWNYVNTLDNPADLLSRGITPSYLFNSKMWFHGPSWLLDPDDQWPIVCPHEQITNIPELKTVLLSVPDDWNNHLITIIEKHSSILKLQRIFAYVLRFKNNTSKHKNSKNYHCLSPNELNNALTGLTHVIQKQSFATDYHNLKKNGTVDSKSKLLSLNPFLDDANIIRVGGRIQHSTFAYVKKHPAILPNSSHFTTIIARYEHLRLLHAGPQALLASIRERFWPLSGRNLVRHIVRNCVRCFKFTAKSESHQMGNLPDTRLTPTRPFLVTGVDYAGPFNMKDRTTRNYKMIKVYVALFVCFSTKAIHLEVVSNLTTECFLAALRRFFSRRGKSKTIYSDNASTFVCANKELAQFFINYEDSIVNNLCTEGIEWKFIPPRSPHFGGIWEAGVKSVKYHLKRVIADTPLTYEEFSTILSQVEACLNSRPLYPLSHDPSDPTSLTPSHFLIGETMTAIPEESLQHIKQNLLSRYQLVQQMMQSFWSRWSKEYISNLQERVKWKQDSTRQKYLKPGILVLVKEDGVPPLKWLLGRITDVHPGRDGIIRAVTLQTSSGFFKRPVVKLCVLPGQD